MFLSAVNALVQAGKISEIVGRLPLLAACEWPCGVVVVVDVRELVSQWLQCRATIAWKRATHSFTSHHAFTWASLMHTCTLSYMQWDCIHVQIQTQTATQYVRARVSCK